MLTIYSHQGVRGECNAALQREAWKGEESQALREEVSKLQRIIEYSVVVCSGEANTLAEIERHRAAIVTMESDAKRGKEKVQGYEKEIERLKDFCEVMRRRGEEVVKRLTDVEREREEAEGGRRRAEGEIMSARKERDEAKVEAGLLAGYVHVV